MKDRRGFLKLLGIGAGAAVAMVAARLAQTSTPAPAPRTIQDIEKVKPYIGPDGVPAGDYIKERPPVIPEPPIVPDLTHPPLQFTFDGDIDIDTAMWEESWNLQPGALIPIPVVMTANRTYTTSGTYDHNLGGYDLAWEADMISDEFGL